MVLCSGGQIIDRQCPNEAVWQNQNGVAVCEFHKLLIEAFTWEDRNTTVWSKFEIKGDKK